MVVVTDELRERLLSYISSQVAKGPESIQSAVRKGQEQLLGVIDGISEEQALFKPDADTWSVVEVLRHVVDGKRRNAAGCAALARGETRGGEAQTGRSGEELPSLAAARSALEASHGELFAAVASFSPATNLEARYEHPWFGLLNCQEWAVFQRIHDGDHAAQIEQVKAAPGFPAA